MLDTFCQHIWSFQTSGLCVWNIFFLSRRHWKKKKASHGTLWLPIEVKNITKNRKIISYISGYQETPKYLENWYPGLCGDFWHLRWIDAPFFFLFFRFKYCDMNSPPSPGQSWPPRLVLCQFYHRSLVYMRSPTRLLLTVDILRRKNKWSSWYITEKKYNKRVEAPLFFIFVSRLTSISRWVGQGSFFFIFLGM